jgi:site-specific recombinase XerC
MASGYPPTVQSWRDTSGDSVTELASLRWEDLLSSFADFLTDTGTPDSTRRWMIADAKLFVAFLKLNQIFPEALTTSDLVAFRETIMNGDREEGGRNYAKSTIRRRLHAVRKFLEYAETTLQGENLLSRQRGLFKVKLPKKRKKLVENKGRQAKAAHTDLSKPAGLRDQAILYLRDHFALSTGQFVSLETTDVDMKLGAIYVRRRNNQKRVYMLDDHGLKVMKSWLATRRLYAGDTSALFIALHWTDGRKPAGDRISERGMRQILRKYGR